MHDELDDLAFCSLSIASHVGHMREAPTEISSGLIVFPQTSQTATGFAMVHLPENSTSREYSGPFP